MEYFICFLITIPALFITLCIIYRLQMHIRALEKQLALEKNEIEVAYHPVRTDEKTRMQIVYLFEKLSAVIESLKSCNPWNVGMAVGAFEVEFMKIMIPILKQYEKPFHNANDQNKQPTGI